LVPSHAFFHNSLDMEKSMFQILPWTLEIYGPEFFVVHEDTKKKGVRNLTPYLLLPI
jgi:hypothetical protein